MTQKELEVINLLHQFNNPWFVAGFILLAAWTIIWKGIALWKAAKNGSLAWFIVLLILNTTGILEILYIFVFSKKKNQTIQQ